MGRFMLNNLRNNLYNKNNFESLTTDLPWRKVANRTSKAVNRAVLEELGQGIQIALQACPSLDYCPISKDEIRNESLLQRQDICIFPDIKKEMGVSTQEDAVIRAATNFLGGGLITGGVIGESGQALDGMTFLPNFRIWTSLLQSLRNSINDQRSEEAKKIDNLLCGLKQFIEYSKQVGELEKAEGNEGKLREAALKYAKTIKSLEPNKSQVIAGGWSNVGKGTGHALIYEICRRGVDRFDVYVYTSTSYQLTESLFIGDKVRLKPVVLYQGVPEERLLFNEDGIIRPHFIQSLMELHVLKKWESGRIVNEEDVLEVFDLIEDYRRPVGLEAFGGITPQRSGTCVPSATKQWIRRHTCHLGLYKQIMFHAKFRLLIGVYHSLKAHLDKDSQKGQLCRRLLSQAARKLLRRIVKLMEGEHGFGSLVDAELAKKAQATAWDLLTEIAFYEKNIIEEKLALKTRLDLKECKVNNQRNLRKESKFILSTPILEKNTEEETILPTYDTQPLTSDNVVERIKSTLKWCDDFSSVTQSNSFYYKNLQISSLVDQFPIPKIATSSIDESQNLYVGRLRDEFWGAFDQGKLEEIMELLNELAKKYISCVYKISPTRYFATLLPLHAITHYLALRVDAQKKRADNSTDSMLESFKIESFISIPTKLPSLTYYDRNEYLRYEEVSNYFKTVNGRAKNEKLFNYETSTRVDKEGVGSSKGNSKYWKGILGTDKTLKEFVEAEGNRRFRDYTQEEIEENYNKRLQIYRERKRKYGSPPERQVNIPTLTKQMALLEEDKNILSKKGYKHVALLRQMTQTCRAGMNGKFLCAYYEIQNFNVVRDSNETKYYLYVEKPKSLRCLGLETKKFDNWIADAQHRRLSSSHGRLFDHHHPQSSRFVEEWNQDFAEGRSLGNAVLDPLLKKVLRTLTEWKLTPYQLLSEFSDELEKFQDPSMQTIFYRLFFRSPVENNKAELGAGQLILEDDALFRECKKFIMKGLAFFQSSPKKIEGGRFFFEFAFYLFKYLADGGAEEKATEIFPLAEINKWLADKSLQKAELATLHLYRALAYSTRSAASLTIEELADAYGSWLIYHSERDPLAEKESFSPMPRYFASNAMIVFTSQLAEKFDQSEFRDQLCTKIFALLGLGNHKAPMIWKKNSTSAAVYQWKRNERDYWIFNLCTGKISGPQGQLGAGDIDLIWESENDFARLFFGEKGFKYTALGDDVVGFTHPTLGRFRLILSGRITGIQRQFPENSQWFEYYSESMQASKTLAGYPDILKYDHALWVPSEGNMILRGGQKIKGYITCLKKHRLKYALTAEGKIIFVDKNGAPFENRSCIDFLEINKDFHPLSQFESPSCILTSRDEKLDLLQQIQFPRYQSQAGIVLSFILKNGKFVWTENHGYALPKETPSHRLGTIKNYLYLASLKKDVSDKLLVPFQPIVVKNTPIPNGRIDIENKTHLIPSSEEGSASEQWGAHLYFVYNLENGRVRPTCYESRLFLAYIFQSQKLYSEAVHLIQTQKPMDALSQASEKIIEMILDMPLGEDHPDAKMVKLQAALSLIKRKDEQASKPIKNYFSDLEKVWSCMKWASSMIQSLNNISFSCRMSTKEEALLMKILLEESKAAASFDAFQEAGDSKYQFIRDHLRRRLDFLNSNKAGQRGHQPVADAFRAYPKKSQNRNRQKFTEKLNLFNLSKRPKEIDDRHLHPSIRSDLKQNYEKKLKEQTDWLKEGTVSLQFTRPGVKFTVKENGKYLLDVLTLAKNGTKSEKNEMLYRLLQWRLHCDLSDLQHYDLLVAFLQFPQNFPDPIDPNHTPVLGKKEFLLDLKKGYERSNLGGQSPTALLKKAFGSEKDAPLGTNENNPLYPTPIKTAFDTKEKELGEIANEKIHLNISLDANTKHWEELLNWKRQFCQVMRSHNQPIYKDFDFAFKPELLSKQNSDYIESVMSELDILQKDYQSGKQQNEEVEELIITKEGCNKLFKTAHERKQNLLADLKSKETELIKKANRCSSDPFQRQIEMARLGAKVQKPLSFFDCLDCLLKADMRAYQLKNKNINSTTTAEEIAKITLEVLDLKTQIAQLDRVLICSKKIEALEDTKCPTRRYLCHQLSQELSARYHFDGFSTDVQIALRVFAGQSGKLPYKKQADVIAKMLKMHKSDPQRYRDIVVQLIMGGGKTSVIATIIMYLSACRNERIGLFIVPNTLFHTVLENFGQAFLEAFNKKAVSLDVQREELSLFKLKNIKALLQASKLDGLPVITKASTIQVFELEFLAQSRRFAKLLEEKKVLLQKNKALDEEIPSLDRQLRHANIYWRTEEAVCLQKKKFKQLKRSQQQQNVRKLGIEKELPALIDKISLLHNIVESLAESGDALFDEVDLVLDCLQEVNFPSGEATFIDPMQNKLLHMIFQCLVSKKLKVETLPGSPTVGSVTKLEENNQELMMLNRDKPYQNHIVAVIAKYVAQNFIPFTNHLNSHTDSFIRYVTNQMPAFLQTMLDNKMECSYDILQKNVPDWKKKYNSIEEVQNDLLFLSRLKELYESGQSQLNEVAKLAGHARYFLSELLPATLEKSGKRDYGISTNGENRIVRYLGINRPATTEYGNQWEEACHYYQWAAAFSISDQTVMNLAHTATAQAHYYMKKYGETFQETAEYQDFLKLCGVQLDRIEEPGMLKRARENLSSDVNKKLDIQAEVVSRCVKYYPERLSSNGPGLLDLVSSRRTFSGTPWNVEGFIPSLANRYKKDQGTMGKIVHTIATRTGKNCIHIPGFSTIEEFLTPIFNTYESPEKIRGIIEVGGIFKMFKDNADVAKQLMLFLKKRSPSIKGVLFFHAASGQRQADTLYIWKTGAKKPERIKGTSLTSLRAKGLHPREYFVYYDQPHTTGTDIPQDPEAVNLVTVNGDTTLRSMGQGIMRLRQFLFSQAVAFVVCDTLKENIYKKGRTENALILNASKAETLKKSEAMLRHFSQQINQLFRQQAIKPIYRAAKSIRDRQEHFAKTILEAEPFFVTQISDDGYLLHGRLSAQDDTKKRLKMQLKEKSAAFENAIGDAEAVHAMKSDVESLEKHILATKSLPKRSKFTPVTIGDQVQVQAQVNQTVQVEQETETNTETDEMLELEMKSYQRDFPRFLRTEKEITEQAFVEMITYLKNPTSSSFLEIISLKNQLKSYNYGLFRKRAPYENLFSGTIYGTKNYFFTFEDRYGIFPIFHPRQKPPKQLLAVRSKDAMRWLLLSEHEAGSVREHLQKLSTVQDVWLIQPDGSLLVSTKGTKSFPLDEKAVLQDLVEINALGGNVGHLEKYPEAFKNFLTKTDRELAIRFLKLATHKQPKQRLLLASSQTVDYLDSRGENALNQYLFKTRLRTEQAKQGVYEPKSQKDVKLMKPLLVPKLHVDWVKFLGIDESKKDPSTVAALEELLQNRDLQSKEKNPAEEWSKRQMRELSQYQVPYITGEQVKWLPLEKIPFLKYPHQIYYKNKESYLLSKEQTLALKEHQISLVPYVNPEYYFFFTQKWQVESVPLEHLDKINPSSYCHLTEKQWHHLPKQCANKLQTIENMPEEKWTFVPGNFLAFIPPQFLHKVTRKQIEEITDTDLVKKLETIAKRSSTRAIEQGLWTSWVLPTMVPSLDFDSQPGYLRDQAQIQAVPNAEVYRLSPDQVALIAQTQVNSLEGEKQIQACPNRYVKHLQKEQLDNTSLEQVPFFSGKDQVQTIKDEARFAKLTEGQIKDIDDSQLKLIQTHQVAHLDNSQLLKLKQAVTDKKWQSLQEGLTKEQMQAFNTDELIALLSEKLLFANLTAPQVRLLKQPWQIQACPDHLVQHLDPKSQIPHIKAEQVQHIKGKEQIRSVPPKFVKMIAKKDFKDVTDAQFKHFSDSQIQTLDTSSLTQRLYRLSPHRLNQLGQEGVQACCDEMITYIQNHPDCYHLIPHIKPEQLHLITNKEAAKNITKRQMQALQPKTYSQLNKSHPLWGRICEKTVDKVPLDKIKNIPNNKLQYLNSKEGIKKISFWRVQYLTREQLRKRSWSQFCTYTLGVLTLGIVGSLAALIAHITLTSALIRCCMPNGRHLFKKLHAPTTRMVKLFSVYIKRSPPSRAPSVISTRG